MKSRIPTPLIREGLARLRGQNEAAGNTAGSLANRVPQHHPFLLPGATMVRETATLPEHSVRNFRRTAAAALPAGNFQGARHHR